MEVNLPEPVANYFAADALQDDDKLRLCFTEDAVVHDENEDHIGVEAILAWRKEAKSKYQYTVEPIEAKLDGQMFKLKALVAGNFPGSPVDLDYSFTLDGGRIAALEIE